LAAVAVVLAAISSAAALSVQKVTAMVASNHALMTVAHRVTVLKVDLTTASKVAKTRLVLKIAVVVATLSRVTMSHVVKIHAATLAKAVAAHVAILAKVMVHHAATSVRHVASKIAPHAALKTAHLHVAHVPRLKQVVHRLTSQAVQPVASRLVAVLMRRSAHLNHACLVN
jgi:hypothetical protein